MQVLEGLCAVVSALPPEQARVAELKMVAPVAEHLMGLLNETRVRIHFVALCNIAPIQPTNLPTHNHYHPIQSPNNHNQKTPQASAPTAGGEACHPATPSSTTSNGSSSKPLPPLARRVEHCLDRLTTIIRFCEPRPLRSAGSSGTSSGAGASAAVESVQRLLPVLEVCYGCYKHKADVMEKVGVFVGL